MSDITKETQLLVIGGGPGGYPAALHAADHGIKPILVDEGPKLGGVCTNRGCIPSKALLHIAKLIEESKEAEEWGVSFGAPKFDLAKMQAFVQQKVVGKLTGGIGLLVQGPRGRGRLRDAGCVRGREHGPARRRDDGDDQVPECRHRHRQRAGDAEGVRTRRSADHGLHRAPSCCPTFPSECS